VRLEVFVDSARIFSAPQFRSMVRDIRKLLPGAVWDLTLGAPHVGSMRRTAEPPTDRATRITQLLSDLRRESVVAERAVRSRSWEPGPMKPGQRANSHEPFSRNHDLGENRAVRRWAWRRIADIDRAILATDEAWRDMELQIAALGAAEIQALRDRQSARERLDLWNKELRARRNRLRALETELSGRGVSLSVGGSFASARSEIKWLQARQPRSVVGFSDLDSSSNDSSLVSDRPEDDRIALRPVSALYELWVAVTCARLIVEKLGFSPSDEAMDSRSEFVPKYFKWSFVCARRGKLTFEFGPRLKTETPDPEIPRVNSADAIRHALRARGESGLFTSSTSVTPDYVMTLCRDEVAAFCIGDATCTDIKHGGKESTMKKRSKVSGYARETVLVSPSGHLTRSSETASFVCVPAANHGVPDEAYSPMVICATPGDDERLVKGMNEVIEALDWYCRARADIGWDAP
jgi:hypothetical protein